MDQPTSEVVTMDAPNKPEDLRLWLSRKQIDDVIAAMSAGDLIAALAIYPGDSVQMPIAAFDKAAERAGLSNGTPASDHVRMSDLKYLGNVLREAVNVESPLSEGQEA